MQKENTPEHRQATIHPPTPKEASLGFWVASYAEAVCSSFIETGHPDADAFISLCSALRDLESEIPGSVPFADRAEELHKLGLTQV